MSLTAGPYGGAANEAGSGFRAGLAAYIAAHILRGQPFADLDLLPEEAVPVSLQLEADVAVDDVHVNLAGGNAFIQAKRKLSFSSGPTSITAVVRQWIAFAEERDFDPSRERLVAAAAEASGPVVTLGAALRRRRRRIAGALTTAETDALARLETLLKDVPQRDRILDSATIWIADLEESQGVAARLAQALLEPGIVPVGSGNQAWEALLGGARDLARKRYGATLEDLIALLRRVPLTLTQDANGYASARAEERRATLTEYRERVQENGETINLRGLGASLPPIRLDDLDGRIKVAPQRPRDQATGQLASSVTGGLPWALRRRGRSLLLGLPGSGKSVALRAAAAHYASRDGWPLPIVVRLDRVARLLPVRGFQEALLEVAFQEEPVEQQAALREAAVEALRTGNAALFLDALDETRQLRGEIVTYIEAELSHAHPAIEMLLSTRDIAYADAHTLGLAELRLAPPERPKETADAILTATAEQRHMPSDHAERWVEERSDWIEQHLHADRALGETPLIVVLLALLACDRSTDDLPRSRSAVLAQVVDAVVTRWEAGLRLQHKPVSLGSLAGEDAVHAAQDAFRIIGDLVLLEGDPTREEVLHKLAEGLRADYGLAPALLRSVASDALALWDEAGVFVIAGVTTRVQARIRLFAELASALTICSHTESVQRRWLAGALNKPEHHEPVLLASGLSTTIVDGLLGKAATDPRLPDLLDLLIKALQQGAKPSPRAIGRLIKRLLLPDYVDADEQRWRAKTIIELPVVPAEQPRALEFFGTLPAALGTLARGISVQTWQRRDPEVQEDLLAVLRIEPPRDIERDPIDRNVIVLTTPDADYQRAVQIAADQLLELNRNDVAELVGRRLHGGVSFFVAARLRRALIDAGFGRIVAREQDRRTREWKEINWQPFSASDEDEVEARLIKLVRGLAEPGPLDALARRRLDGLASLISSTRFFEAPAGEAIEGVMKEGKRLEMLLRTVALLGGLKLPELASEAQEMLDILDEEGEGNPSPLFMLGDEPLRLSLHTWDRIPDQHNIVKLLGQAVSCPYHWMGVLAVNCLAGAPAPARQTALRELQAQLHRSHSHVQFLLAVAILALDDTELAHFSTDERPTVRRAAAYGWRRDSARSPELLAALIADLDAGAALEAVKAVRHTGLTEKYRPHLEEALREPRAWQCFLCGEENSAGHSNCAKCETRPPDLKREITAALADSALHTDAQAAV